MTYFPRLEYIFINIVNFVLKWGGGFELGRNFYDVIITRQLSKLLNNKNFPKMYWTSTRNIQFCNVLIWVFLERQNLI